MSTLYLNCGKTDLLTKKDYLLEAARSAGITNVVDYAQAKHMSHPVEYVLNIQPYAEIISFGTEWTGSWEIECLVGRERLTWWWKKLDTIFLANRMDWMEKKPKNVRYLMQACLPELYDFKVEKEYDLVQIGNMKDYAYFKDFGYPDENIASQDKYDIYKKRRETFEKLKERYNVLVVDTPKRLPVKDYLRQLARGKIQFIQSMDVYGEGEIAQRFFESLPMGPVLTNYAQDLDHLNLTPDGDYCVYHNEEEMFNKIDELLNDDALRSDIAMHGREKALSEHTFINRLNQIFELLRNHYGFRM